MSPALAAAIVAFLVFGAVSVLAVPSTQRRRMLDRLATLRAGRESEPADLSAHDRRLLRDDAVAKNTVIRALLRRVHWTEGRAVRLERADIPLNVSEYALLLGLLFVVVAAVSGLITGLIPVAIIAGGIAVFVAEWLLGFRAQRRGEQFNQQLPHALQIMATSLRSGFGIMEAVRTVGREMDAPLGTAFTRILDEHRVGGSLDVSLNNLATRIESVDFMIVARALQTHRKVGGNLAEILERVAETMREREKLRGHVRAITAEQRFSGFIVGLLPLWVLGFFALVEPSFIAPLWQEPLGRILLGTGAILEVSAFLLMRRIARIEV